MTAVVPVLKTPYYLQNFIDGRFVAPVDNNFIDNINPATAEVVSKIPNSNEKDINIAVKAAQAAFPGWRNTPAEQRGEYLQAIARELKKVTEELVMAESRDMGKPYVMCRDIDIPTAISKFEHYPQFYASQAMNYYQLPDAVSVEHRDPVGVVGLISPWNFPFLLLSEKVSACIMCGNTCVLKPPELASTTSFLLAEAITRAKLPKGVVNIVMGLGVSAGEPLVKHPKVRAISFTGGGLTGARIASLAAPQFKKLQLELGGKNPTVVFSDCYFDETVAGAAFAGLMNTGQVCVSGSRVVVEKKIADKFTKALVEHVKQVYSSSVGDPKHSMLGPLVSHAQREKVEAYVALAKQEGGKVVLGGQRPRDLPAPFDKGAFYMPTIITNLPHTARAAREEIFGPVITIHTFDSEEEAVKIANCVDYGLASSVWTSDVRKGQRIARQIEAGMVWINCWGKSDPRQPFGGVKNSGMGRENGAYSVDFYTEVKPIVSKL